MTFVTLLFFIIISNLSHILWVVNTPILKKSSKEKEVKTRKENKKKFRKIAKKTEHFCSVFLCSRAVKKALKNQGDVP